MHAMEVTAIQLPLAFSALTGICKYRDEICAHFGLALRRIGGNGSCFFHACVLLLSKQGIQVTPEGLRLQVISFFRECQQGQHGDLGERIMTDIQHEVPEALISSSRKHNKEVPANVTSYLDASLNPGVWVAGYHWIRAVAHLYQVCLVVVIHGYQCVYAFGNTSHVQLFLYKRDIETHYDALVLRVSSEVNLQTLYFNCLMSLLKLRVSIVPDSLFLLSSPQRMRLLKLRWCTLPISDSLFLLLSTQQLLHLLMRLLMLRWCTLPL